MNILERRKADIFSICIFNRLRNFRPNFFPFFFHDPQRPQNELNLLISVISIFAWLSPFIANLFHF